MKVRATNYLQAADVSSRIIILLYPIPVFKGRIESTVALLSDNESDKCSRRTSFIEIFNNPSRQPVMCKVRIVLDSDKEET